MIPSIGEKRGRMNVFAIEDCSNCGLKTKRAFQQGDYVFKQGPECARCKHQTLISMIFAESVKVS